MIKCVAFACAVIALSGVSFAQLSSADRTARALEGIEMNMQSNQMDRMLEKMNRDSITAMNIQQLQTMVTYLHQQNQTLAAQLADAKDKNTQNQEWFRHLKDGLDRRDVVQISKQLSAMYKTFCKKNRADMVVDIKAR